LPDWIKPDHAALPVETTLHVDTLPVATDQVETTLQVETLPVTTDPVATGTTGGTIGAATTGAGLATAYKNSPSSPLVIGLLGLLISKPLRYHFLVAASK
jgi:hypothetical protein